MYERNYHANISNGDEKKGKSAKRRITWRTIALTLFISILVGGFVTAMLLNQLQVREVRVDGAISADPKDVSDYVLERMNGTWLWVFPKTSIVLLPDHSLEKAVKRAFPKFSQVSVSRSNTHAITVGVTEYEGTYLWCEDNGTCWFMSTDGIVFAPAPYFSGSAYIKIFIGTVEGLPFAPIQSAQLETIGFLTERLRAINIEPSEFHLYDAPDRIEIVFYHNGNAARIIIDSSIPSDKSLESLFTALRTAPFAGQYRDGLHVLEYIDVRLPNKVVYKFK